MQMPLTTEDLRHPMWTPPRDDVDMCSWRRALLKQIAASLTPFDGRPNSEEIVEFARSIYYDATVILRRDGDQALMLGTLCLRRARTIAGIHAHQNNIVDASIRSRLTQQALVIDRMTNQFIDAITAAWWEGSL